MKMLIWFLFINSFNYFPQIYAMIESVAVNVEATNTNPFFNVEVKIKRVEHNPEYAFLYEKTNSSENQPPHFKLELRTLIPDWNEKREDSNWKGQIVENNSKFDKFTFEKLPNEWFNIKRPNLELELKPMDDQKEIVKKLPEIWLELRIELLATKEIRFRLIRLHENADGLYFEPIDLLPMMKLKRQIKDLKRELNEEDYLRYSYVQLAFCMEQRKKFLEDLINLDANEAKNQLKFYLISQVYRDLQWQIYNVQRLRLHALDKMNKKIEIKNSLNGTIWAMNEYYLPKILESQTEYIKSRMELKGNMPMIYENLLKISEPIDEYADIINKKLKELEYNIRKRKRNENENIATNLLLANHLATKTIINPYVTAGQMWNFRTKSVQNVQELRIRTHISNNYWPSKILAKSEVTGPSIKPRKRKMPLDENEERNLKKSSAAHRSSTNKNDKIASNIPFRIPN